MLFLIINISSIVLGYFLEIINIFSIVLCYFLKIINIFSIILCYFLEIINIFSIILCYFLKNNKYFQHNFMLFSLDNKYFQPIHILLLHIYTFSLSFVAKQLFSFYSSSVFYFPPILNFITFCWCFYSAITKCEDKKDISDRYFY